jgi:2-polyprenyl-3-methyl-5-hydroxy-6-metoxy-1,4-benzoquinol methylase
MSSDVCPVCKSAHFTPLFLAPFPEYGDDGRRAYELGTTPPVPTWRIVRCHGCTAAYPNPYPSADVIADYYASQAEPSEFETAYYIDVSQHERDHWADFALRVVGLEPTPGKLLEIGCAAGWLLVGARDAGWDAYGLEASPKFADHARDTLGLTVHTGTLEDCRDGGDNVVTRAAPFDIVVLTDVLEHLHDPVRDLRTMRDLLAPDGLLVVATLDFGSPSARRYGLDWRQIVVSHIVYWTRPSIRQALEDSGFEVRDVSTFWSWDPDARRERRRRARQLGKFVARQALVWTYVPLAGRSRLVRELPGRLTRGRLDHETLSRKIGDQPTLGDVMLVVATPARRPAAR